MHIAAREIVADLQYDGRATLPEQHARENGDNGISVARTKNNVGFKRLDLLRQVADHTKGLEPTRDPAGSRQEGIVH